MTGMARSATVLLALVLFLLPTGCVSESGTSERTSLGAVSLDPDLTVGLIEGDSTYLFGDIRTVAVDRRGRVYVGDRIGASVRAYDPTGTYLGEIAREGEGPGEITGWPADLTLDSGGRLYIRDATRITVFSPTVPGGAADSVTAIWRLPGYGNLSSTRSRAGDAGEYYYPSYLFMQDEHPRFFYLPFREGSVSNDTLEVPPYPGLTGWRQASYRTGPGGGRLLPGLSYVPFAPLPVWDVTPMGTVISSDGAANELVETAANGDTVRVIALPPIGDLTVPEGERADSARALGARLDSLAVPIDDVIGLGEGVRERRLPETIPPVIGIHVGSDRSIWVERWPAEGEGGSRLYDVLDEDGNWKLRIILRAPLVRDPPPFFGGNYVVGVVVDPETEVERVVRFALGGIG